MSHRTETFEVGPSPRVVASTRSGDIRVVPGEAGSVHVAVEGSGVDRVEISQVGDVISVEGPRTGKFLGSSADIALTVPEGASMELACTSGNVSVQCPVAELRVSVASGDVRVDVVSGLCHVNSASGDINIGGVLDAEVNTASGTVRLGTVHRHLRVKAASGDIYVDEVGDTASCKGASSNLRINRLTGTELRHKTMSGDVQIGIPARRSVELDFTSLSGSLRNKLPQSDGSPAAKSLLVSVTTVSGDLTLTGC
jgi:DUF4097 and DUF4098 domain-containing protein YvlB